MSNGLNQRALCAGGTATTNIISYITITSLGDAQNFGDLTLARGYISGTSNATYNRGIIAGGYSPTIWNIIEYVLS